jgi:hypothetical protein
MKDYGVVVAAAGAVLLSQLIPPIARWPCYSVRHDPSKIPRRRNSGLTSRFRCLNCRRRPVDRLIQR